MSHHPRRHVGPQFVGFDLCRGLCALAHWTVTGAFVSISPSAPAGAYIAVKARPLDRARLGRAPVRPALTYARLFAIFAANPIAKRTLASRITLGAANVSFGPVSVATKATCIK